MVSLEYCLCVVVEVDSHNAFNSYYLNFKLCVVFIFLFVAWQDYGDLVEVDGFDIDYGVRILFVRISYE